MRRGVSDKELDRRRQWKQRFRGLMGGLSPRPKASEFAALVSWQLEELGASERVDETVVNHWSAAGRAKSKDLRAPRSAVIAEAVARALVSLAAWPEGKLDGPGGPSEFLGVLGFDSSTDWASIHASMSSQEYRPRGRAVANTLAHGQIRRVSERARAERGLRSVARMFDSLTDPEARREFAAQVCGFLSSRNQRLRPEVNELEDLLRGLPEAESGEHLVILDASLAYSGLEPHLSALFDIARRGVRVLFVLRPCVGGYPRPQDVAANLATHFRMAGAGECDPAWKNLLFLTQEETGSLSSPLRRDGTVLRVRNDGEGVKQPLPDVAEVRIVAAWTEMGMPKGWYLSDPEVIIERFGDSAWPDDRALTIYRALQGQRPGLLSFCSPP